MVYSAVIFHIIAAWVYATCAFQIYNFLVAPFCAGTARIHIGQAFTKALKKLVDRIWRAKTKARVGTLDHVIQQQVGQFRVEQCRKFLTAVAVCATPIMLIAGIQTQVQDSAKPFRFGAFAVAYFILVMVATDVIKLTSRRLDLLFAFLACLTIVMVAQMVEDPSFWSAQGARLFVRQALCILFLDVLKSIPLNMVISILTCWTYQYNSSLLLTGEDRHIFFVLQEVFLFAWTSLGCYFVQIWLEDGFRAQLIAQNQRSAMRKLAAYKCDAVFSLCPNLCLREPAPQLAHILSAEGSHNHLDGMPIEDYIPGEAEQERFRSFLMASVVASDPEGLPALIRMDLQDSHGRTLPVDVFHSCFIDDTDQTCHIISICLVPAIVQVEPREDDEHPRGESEPLAPSAAQACRQEWPILIGRTAEDDERLDAAPEAHEAPSRHSTEFNPPLVSLIPEHQAVAPVSMVYDASHDAIVACTAALSTLIGPICVTTSIRDIVVNSTDFLSWLQHWSNEFTWNDEVVCQPLHVRLKPPIPIMDRDFEFQAEGFLLRAQEQARRTEIVADAGFREVREDDSLCIVEFRVTEARRLRRTGGKRARQVDASAEEQTNAYLVAL